jgi:aspartokinase-like uncharacterized kinase
MSRPEGRGPLVVKVGGSLLDWRDLPRELERFLEPLSAERVVLIAGGGAMVDVLRELDSVHGIGEKRSHALSLRTLDVTARILADLVPGLRAVERLDELGAAWEARTVPVLAPRVFLETVDRLAPDALAETWSATSDSIAARVARSLRAERLVLLKSTAPDRPITREAASELGLVDPVFPAASAGLPAVELVNLRSKPPVVVDLC